MQTTRQLLYDTTQCVIMQFTGFCDDGLQEIAVVKVDPSEFNEPSATVSILRIEYEVNKGLVRVLWDADDPKTFADLASVNVLDYECMRGAVNPTFPGSSGKILFSTIGFEVGSSYNIKITMKKKFSI